MSWDSVDPLSEGAHSPSPVRVHQTEYLQPLTIPMLRPLPQDGISVL